MFKKLLILTLSALLCCGAAIAADTTSMTDKVRQAETQSLPSTIKHLDLVLVLDKSGSMYGLESDTIGGYNAMIAKEKDLDVDTKVTTVLFNNKVDILTDRSNINSLSDMTTKDYRVGGSTALLDAVATRLPRFPTRRVFLTKITRSSSSSSRTDRKMPARNIPRRRSRK